MYVCIHRYMCGGLYVYINMWLCIRRYVCRYVVYVRCIGMLYIRRYVCRCVYT